MRLAVLELLTTDELKQQRELSLWEYKLVRHRPDSNDFNFWDTDYKKIHAEFERRKMLDLWSAMIAEFQEQNKRKQQPTVAQ